MTAEPLEAIGDIRQRARGALLAAGMADVQFVDLDRVTDAVDLHQVDLFELGADAPSKLRDRIKRLPSKLLGLLAVKQKTIYVDPDLVPTRKRFTIAHEIGHRALPWQNDAFHVDDKNTLALTTRDEFEREANAFGAELLFGAGRFNREADDEALGLATPLALSSLYGTSAAATIRQYAEHNHRPVALLAISRFETSTTGGFVRLLMTDQCVSSPSFVTRFGHLDDLIPHSRLTPSQPLFHVMHDLTTGVGDTTEMTLETRRGVTKFTADTFSNGRLHYALLYRNTRLSGQKRELVGLNGRPLQPGRGT
jgi:hypothetical protein